MPVMDTLNEKTGPLPLWGWGVGAALLAGYVIIKRKNASSSAANQNTTQAAANQTNSNLGSASQLANLFEVAGLMPYQGGDTYVNVTAPSSSSSSSSSSGGTTGGGGAYPGGNPSGPPRGTHPPIPAGTPPPKQTTGSTPSQSVKSYTVKSGDTMIGIASKQFGLPANEQGADTLYYSGNNATTIRNKAEQHGHTSDFVHWIYPGEVLTYPTKR
jgi:nucleoid-associated protein YgaU